MRKPLFLACSMVVWAAPVPAAAQTAFTTYTRFDAEHRVTGVIAPDPDGGGPLRYPAVRNSYDAAGRLVRVEKGELTDWQPESVAPRDWPAFSVKERIDTGYDALDRKVSEAAIDPTTGGAMTLTQTSYDNAGRLACVAVRMNPAAFGAQADACALGAAGSQGPDRIVHNLYDAAGQLTQVQKAYGVTTANGFPATLQQNYATYEYTLNGKQKTVIDANGNRAEMTYDGFDRQTRWVFPSAVTVGQANAADYEEYGYDANGNRTSLRKRDGSVIGYQYDALNRVTVKTVPALAGAAGYSVYTGYDNRSLELYARFGSTSGLGVTNAYDNAGRLTSSTSNMDGTARTWSHQLDGDGNVLVLSGDAGYSAAFSYDGLDRMTEYQSVFQIGYDAAGRRSSVTMGPSYSATSSAGYGYDGAGRLQTLTHGLADPTANQSVTFGYNPASQVVSEARTNDAYASTSALNTARTYRVNGLNQYSDVAGNGYAYDLNGNLTSDGINNYAYDGENRLVSRSGGVALSYDPLGRLWQVAGPSTLSRFLYDGDRLVQEYDGAGNPTSAYVHGPGADEPLTWYSAAGRHHLHADHQGSITAIADDAGNKVQINGYDPWGVPNAGNIGRFGYTGQVWLPELGMWYYKARIYSPMLGRFLQTDPIGYKDQMNLYGYVGNDPTDQVDHTGEQATANPLCSGCHSPAAPPPLTVPQAPAINTLGAVVGCLAGPQVCAQTALNAVLNDKSDEADKKASQEGRNVITEGKRPAEGERQIDNRGEGRKATDVLDDAAKTAGVKVDQTKDGRSTVVFPDGTRATAYPTSGTTGGPSIVISKDGKVRVKTREDEY